MTRTQTAISRRSLAALLILLFSPIAFAQHVELSSPLDGQSRAGRVSAIRVVTDGLTGDALTLSAAGAIPIRIPILAGRVDAVVPLAWRGEPAAELTWTDGRSSGAIAVAPKPLGVDDRLIAVAGGPADVAAFAAALFPGKRPVVVSIDADRPRVASPAIAFSSADALLLDPAAASRVDESQLATLLACGTAVAIRSDARPAGGWPWVRVGQWWVARHDVAGPTLGGVTPDAYAPTYPWDRSWPEPVRRSALLAAVAAAVVILASAVWRSRWSIIVGMAACAAAAVGAIAFGRSLGSVVTASGDVMIAGDSIVQTDRWTYFSAVRDATTSIPASDGATAPAWASRRAVDGLGVVLECAADGSPVRFDVTLPAKTTLAFLSRTVSPATSGVGGTPSTAPATPSRVESPIGLFADKLYPGTVVGESVDRPADALGGDWWGTVRMRR